MPCGQLLLQPLDLTLVLDLITAGIIQFQLHHVNERVRVASKHAGSTGAVLRSFLPLIPLAVVVTVYYGAVQLIADPVKLIAELCHLVSGILVTGDYLIDRVNDNSGIIPLHRTPDQTGRKLRHRHGLPPQVPDVNILRVDPLDLVGVTDVLDTVQATCPVKFQIDI